MSEEIEEMSEEMSEVYEFVYRLEIVYNAETGEVDYNYCIEKRPEGDDKKIAIAQAEIESAIYWGGLGRLCEEREVIE